MEASAGGKGGWGEGGADSLVRDGGKEGGEGYWKWSDKKGGGWALDLGRFAVLIKPSDDFTFFFLFSNMSFSPLLVLSIPIPQQNQNQNRNSRERSIRPSRMYAE